MIREITIENFKSIESLTLPLGQVTVLIGENGAGKSNILEAIAFFGAAVHNKVEPEFMFARGVRGCSNLDLLSAFDSKPLEWRAKSFHLIAKGTSQKAVCEFLIGNSVSSRRNKSGEWTVQFGSPVAPTADTINVPFSEAMLKDLLRYAPLEASLRSVKQRKIWESIKMKAAKALRLGKATATNGMKMMPTPFVIYSPENTALRTFEAEGQMRPLGVRGEGLFKMVQRFAEESPETFDILRRELKLFDWFSDFSMPKRLGMGESRLDIKDRFLAAKRLIDQRSANEGFLFVLFYLCLFLSPQTPKFFAIDNIDASLNPKLCAELMRRLVVLAKERDKQVVITTHNPAILDGLDLNDKAQVLYAVQRNDKGRSIAQRIPAPKPQPGEAALKLSHAYLRGLLGGVPKNF